MRVRVNGHRSSSHAQSIRKNVCERMIHPLSLVLQPCLGILITFFSQSQRISADPLASCCKSTASSGPAAAGSRISPGDCRGCRGRCSATGSIARRTGAVRAVWCCTSQWSRCAKARTMQRARPHILKATWWSTQSAGGLLKLLFSVWRR
jgi:hypothetical protein